jgi:voltage-gated potassium channel Kch
MSVCKLRPESRGTVHIKSRDPHAAPAIAPNFLEREADVATMLDGLKLVRGLAHTLCDAMDPRRHRIPRLWGERLVRTGLAAALVIAIGDAETALEIARTARTHFPQLRILARAENRPVTFDLLELGIAQVYRDTLDTALRVGVDALRAVGVRAHRAHRSAQAFRRYDEQHLHLLAGEGRQEMTSFLSRVRATVADLEDTLQRDFAVDDQALADAAWDAESLRREFAPRP